MSDFFRGFGFPSGLAARSGNAPVKLSVRTLGRAVEDALIETYSRAELETVLPDELDLTWPHDDSPSQSESKRTLIAGYMEGWGVPQMATLARRVVGECAVPDMFADDLRKLLRMYDAGGGVSGATKNLIFAANGPKPQIVLRDAVNNDIEIVKNAEFCLIYDDPLPPEGLRFTHLVHWWREREQLADTVSDRDVGLALHNRLRDSLDSPAERVIFEAYASRYKTSFDTPALIPQVYLHYDPYDQRTHRAAGATAPLPRQRMDFLLLFSDRRRVVIEVDGKHHYADGDRAEPGLYAQMVAEDRRLRLAGYEVFRFGGAELFDSGSKRLVEDFFDQLATRMA